MNILITGDSHIGALKQGLNELARLGRLPARHHIEVQQIGGGILFVSPFFSDEGDHVAFIEGPRWRKVNRLPLAGRPFDWYGVCAPLHASRLWRRKQWEYYMPMLKQTDKMPVSSSVVHRLILQDVENMLRMLEVLQRIGVNFFVVEAPKPYRHHRAVNYNGSELVLYLDRVYRQTVRDWLAARNISVIDVPESCYDADGFMYEHFRHEDADDLHHANQSFGIVMLEEIMKFADDIGQNGL